VDILAFADSDDAVAGDWLAELTRAIRDDRADLVGGLLRLPAPAGGASPVVAPEADFWHEQSVFGGSLAVSAAAWRRLGGFDPALRCCEDTDLAWRAAGAGLRVGVAPAAITDVANRPPLREFLQRFRWGWWSVVLLRKHGLAADRIPRLRTLFAHKRATHFHRHAIGAALGQWFGQSCCRASLRAARLVGHRQSRRPGGP
jgi:GT2 family glycosyltransferase